MKCEFCHIKDACVEVQQITEEGLRQVRMCADCAASKGIKPPDDLAGLLAGGGLFSTGSEKMDSVGPESKTGCPVCHMRVADFRKTSRLGCANCYETFAGILNPILESMHRTTVYEGKQPVGEDIRRELTGLKAELTRAIAAEAYEQAADLRDRINLLALENTSLDAEPSEEASV